MKEQPKCPSCEVELSLYCSHCEHHFSEEEEGALKADTPDYERGYVDGAHEATEDYLRWGAVFQPTGHLGDDAAKYQATLSELKAVQRKRVARRAAYLIASNIVWLEDQAVQRSIEPDIKAMILRSFSDDNQEGN